MKKQDEQLLIWGGAAVAAYFLFFKKQATTTTNSGTTTIQASNPNVSATGNAVNQITSGLASIIKTITSGSGSSTPKTVTPVYTDDVITVDSAAGDYSMIAPGEASPYDVLNQTQIAGIDRMGLMAGALVEELEM